jgi:hypothetical protein
MSMFDLAGTTMSVDDVRVRVARRRDTGWWGEEPWPRVIGTASTLPDTPSNDMSGDNEGGGGPALSSLIAYARTQYLMTAELHVRRHGG